MVELEIALPQIAVRQPLVKCVVRVAAGDDLHVYDGLFPHTFDAVVDALERFTDARKINVQQVAA